MLIQEYLKIYRNTPDTLQISQTVQSKEIRIFNAGQEHFKSIADCWCRLYIGVKKCGCLGTTEGVKLHTHG